MQSLSIDFLLRNLIAALLMPPLLWICLAGAALLFLKRRLKVQRLFVGMCLLMIWVTSTTAFANWLVAFSGQWMDWPVAIKLSDLKVSQHQQPSTGVQQKPLTEEQLTKEQLTKQQLSQQKLITDKEQLPVAIVVLGGGKLKGVLDRNDLMMEDLSKDALQRLRYAALLSRHTNLPILVTGGAPEPSSKYPSPEAQVMAKVLLEDFNVKVRWIEEQSKTTQENAQYSAKILEKEQIHHIYLVTNFWHLPRAKKIFEKYGFIVTSAPMGFEFGNEFDMHEITVLDFLPGPAGLQRVREIWHEAMGGIWYHWRYKLFS